MIASAVRGAFKACRPLCGQSYAGQNSQKEAASHGTLHCGPHFARPLPTKVPYRCYILQLPSVLLLVARTGEWVFSLPQACCDCCECVAGWSQMISAQSHHDRFLCSGFPEVPWDAPVAVRWRTRACGRPLRRFAAPSAFTDAACLGQPGRGLASIRKVWKHWLWSTAAIPICSDAARY